jgi:hypothetical protein
MDGTRAPVSTLLTGVRVRLWRFVGYFAALRPIFVLGLIVTCLPLTTIPRVLAGTMLGNLFVEYGFWQAFWFGAVLFGAVWALMFLAGLSLDAERDRDDRWVYDPQRDQTPPSVRRVSVPIDDWRTVACFTALAAPGVLSVVAHADRGADAAVGLTLGAVAMYLVVDAGLTLLQLADRERRILPWRPLFFLCATHWFGEPTLRVAGAPARAFTALASRLARLLRVPPSFFRPGDPTTLESDHVFAAATLLFVAAVWTVLYWTLGPTGRWYAKLESLPPAGLLYLLIVFVLFLVAFVWTQFRRYRLTLYAFVALIIGVSCVQGLGGVEGGWLLGQPLHTYDVYRVEPRQAVALSEVVAPLAAVGPSASGREPTLIVVTASGGGILAAAWTTKVLGELEAAYPRLRDELRLISAVSGGSLGVVHYVLAHEGHPGSLDANALCRVVEHAACTSLAAAAYGFVFPDLYRVLSPLRVPELDRARLQERRWAAIARGGLAASSDVHLLAAWSDDIRSGAKPAVILNATVLETGERIAITPLDTLATPDGPDEPTRHLGARTLAEFLGEKAGYSVDVWTAARLSATFSYVSPPARACLRPAPAHACEDARAFGDGRRDADLHLIDGGYADDFGVASAIDWLGRELRRCRTTGSCPFDRVALVEIRAKPFEGVGATPSFGWVAEWLGPPKGLATSWAFAQRSANDTAVDLVRELDRGREIESFVFEPAPTGRACGPCAAPSSDGETPCARSFPLSWHLSRAQKACINEFWLDEPNQRTLREFLDFVGGRPAEAEQLRPFGERGGGRVSEPVDACVTGACEPGPPPP